MKYRLLPYLASILLLSSAIDLAADNKVVYVISPPRSLSTVCLRMMQARGDFQVLNEPGVSAFYYLHYPEFAPQYFRTSGAPKNYEESKELVFQSYLQGNVFVKEMLFAAKEYLLDMPGLLLNKDAYFVFLIRNPHHAFLSYYKKLPILDDDFADVMSYKDLYELYQEVKANSYNPPFILLAEDFYANTQQTVQNLCNYIGIPFKEDSLHWQALGSDFNGFNEWHENKYPELVQHWHGAAIQSSGIGTPSTYAVDEKGLPTFEEIEDPMHREGYMQVYQAILPYYQLFLKEAASK